MQHPLPDFSSTMKNCQSGRRNGTYALLVNYCQEILRVMLLNRDQVILAIQSNNTQPTHPDEVFLQIIEGIGKMLALCARDGYAFWTSGTEQDRLRAASRMKQCMLPPEHRNYLEPPHQKQRKSELILRANIQLSELRSLTQNGSLDKRLRRIINQLPQ